MDTIIVLILLTLAGVITSIVSLKQTMHECALKKREREDTV